MPFRQDEIPPADWNRFRGCNHQEFPQINYKRGAGFSFSDFIGKPLSDRLWNVLVEVVKPRGLWIIGPNKSQWCIDCDVIIDVSELDEVTDIRFSSRMFRGGLFA